MKNGRNGFVKNLSYFCLIVVIALGLMTIIATGGGDGGGNGGDTGDGGTSGIEGLLEGDPEERASTALTDLDSGDRISDTEITTDPDGGQIVRTKLEIAFLDTATIEEVNALLESVDAAITSMLEGVNLLVVRIPDPGSLAGLDDVVSQLEADPIVLYVTKLYLPVPRELPGNYTAGTSDLTLIVHHLAVRAHAAWNARAALDNPASHPPLLIVEDFFGDGPPNHDFAVISTLGDVATGNLESHGYHVLGIISAKHGGGASGAESLRGLATGIYPGTLELRVVDHQSGLDPATSQNLLIMRIKNASKNVVVNSSLGFPDFPTATLPSWCMKAARSWIKRLRGSVLYETGTTGPDSLENNFLHCCAAGNIGQGLPTPEAPRDSEYNMARLLPDLETEMGVSLPNLTNTLVIENRTNSPDQPYRADCLDASSKYPGDLSAVGTKVHSLTGSSSGTDSYTGTSMASPQAAGLAAYVWALAPRLTPQELLSLLKTTARYSSLGCSPAPQSVIDAYSAVLAVDDASALQEGGSPGDAKVRLAILDVVDGSGSLGGNGAFDEKDVQYLVGKVSGSTPELDYSRCDLNGDGWTGGEGTDKVNLDIDYPPTYGSVAQEILGETVTFSERNVTDMQVLCYYAYSNLYTGDEAARDTAMEPVKDKCGGGLIAYVRMPLDKGARQIHIMNDDGTNSEAIPSWPGTWDTGNGLAWSPEGDKIAASLPVYSVYEIFVMNSDGTGLAKITDTSSVDEVQPAWGECGWSSENTIIAYIGPFDGTYERIGLMWSDGTGGDLVPIDPNFYPWHPEHPTWSADGWKLAYDDSLPTHIYVHDFAPDPDQVTDLGLGINPSWSPNGDKIAFIGGGQLNMNELWVMNEDGSGRTLLQSFDKDSYTIYELTWSPNSKRIAFELAWWDAPNSQGYDYDICVIDADGTDFTNITSTLEVWERWPAWRP